MGLEELLADKSFISGSENPGEISDQQERLRKEKLEKKTALPPLNPCGKMKEERRIVKIAA